MNSSEDKEEESEERPSRNIIRGDDEMTFLEHLEELRFTLARCIGAFAVGVIILAFFLPSLTDFLRMPFVWAQGASDPDMLEGLFSRRPMGVFTVMLQVLFLGGLSCSLPFMLFALAQFVAPALTEKEKEVLVPALTVGFFLFLLGVAFAFFVILPAAFRVSIALNSMLGLELLWSASEYYSLVVWLCVLMGALFEFPVVLVLLVHLGILTPEALRGQRKLVFIGILVLSAIITPTGDPITLMIMTGPLYGLYEIAIWVGSKWKKKRSSDLEEEEEFDEDYFGEDDLD
ncbi:MAG: twin-arginine translocase subunit TatC [Verrucomicrobiota bacterium]